MVFYLAIAILCIFDFSSEPSSQHGHKITTINLLPQESPRDERWMWQLPRHLMKSLNLEEGMQVADVGCGDGYFTVYLSEAVGPTGAVYASDIDYQAIETLKERIQRDSLINVIPVHGTESDPLLPARTLDRMLLVNVTHLLQNRVSFFERLKYSLKPGGWLMIVQWDVEKLKAEQPEAAEPWEPEPGFLEPFLLEDLMKAGFQVVETEEYLPLQRIYHCR